MQAIRAYSRGLFDAALRKPPPGFRRPTGEELQQADRAGWQEIARLVSDGSSDINAALVHVSKPGGFLASVIKPVQKTTLQTPPKGKSKGEGSQKNSFTSQGGSHGAQWNGSSGQWGCAGNRGTSYQKGQRLFFGPLFAPKVVVQRSLTRFVSCGQVEAGEMKRSGKVTPGSVTAAVLGRRAGQSDSMRKQMRYVLTIQLRVPHALPRVLFCFRTNVACAMAIVMTLQETLRW